MAALPLAWLIAGAWGGAALAAAALMAFAVGIWASEECLKISGDDDPKPVVIDEICGQWLVLAVAPLDVLHYALGFALFRVFDILKPWPVSWADREIKGGLGVMLDDVLAAGYAVVLLFGIRYGLGI